jgi:hypothetical protein
MANSCPEIDYEDMIADLTDDIEGNYIDKNAMLYIVRMKTPVYCEAYGGEVRPVIDYFYETPALFTDIKTMTVKDCKEICFAALEKLEDSGDEALKAAVGLIIEDLKDYTKGNSGRNERNCKVVFQAESLIPMMVYYDDSDAADEVESISVADLVTELIKSSNG